jgi:DNA repair protein RecO (recombination protein O)
MIKSIDGVLTSSVDYGEHDKLITILTAEEGKIQAIAKGARSMRSQYLNATQPFVYGNFELYKKGDLYWLRAGSPKNSFYGLSGDLECLALANYVCDVANDISGEGVEADSLLRLVLNCLYVLSERKKAPKLVKAVFELRAAAMSGYYPLSLDLCDKCSKKLSYGKDSVCAYFEVEDGRLVCPECFERSSRGFFVPSGDEARSASELIPLGDSALAAFVYTLSSPMERMFAFEVSDKDEMRAFSHLSEAYLLAHLERSFDTLDFYKTVCD